MANAVSLIRGPGAPLGFLHEYVEATIGERMPDILVGSGAADGDASPFLESNKGTLYLRTDNTDDAGALYLKVDESGDDNDWDLIPLSTHTHA